MARWVIYKASRTPDKVNGSYSGPTWDGAGIRHLYKPFYDECPDYLITLLSVYNPVGFYAEDIDDPQTLRQEIARLKEENDELQKMVISLQSRFGR